MSAADERLDPGRLDQLWDFGDPAASETRFRAEIDAVTPGSTAALELTTQLARAIGLQRRFDEATELLKGIRATASPPVVAVRLALERGRILNSSGRATDAVPYFVDALTAAEGAGEDFLAIDAAHMLGIADSDRAEAWDRRTLAMIGATGDERSRRWTGSLHNNLGWTLHDRGDLDQALDQFESARVAYTVDGTPKQLRVAHWAVARCLRSLDRTDEALVIQERLAEGPSDGYVEEELGELYRLSGNPERARMRFAAAADLLGADDWVVANEPEKLARLRALAAGD